MAPLRGRFSVAACAPGGSEWLKDVLEAVCSLRPVLGRIPSLSAWPTPDALDFIRTAETQGVRAAVKRRDGPFGDYSQAPPGLRPDPNHVIIPDSRT
jgi:hypothetical protein